MCIKYKSLLEAVARWCVEGGEGRKFAIYFPPLIFLISFWERTIIVDSPPLLFEVITGRGVPKPPGGGGEKVYGNKQ